MRLDLPGLAKNASARHLARNNGGPPRHVDDTAHAVAVGDAAIPGERRRNRGATGRRGVPHGRRGDRWRLSGSAIVRSFGRRGVPVCVLDDERSVTRAPRYVQRFVRVPVLRAEQSAVDELTAAGRRFGLDGWVLFPTRTRPPSAH
jgi:hypothetical protein